MAAAHDTWTVLPHGPIEKLTDNLWRVQGDLPNMPIKRVLTVARKTDGRLVIHNAIAMNDAAMAELEDWGEPAFLVVPNGHHRLDAPAFKRRYPKIIVVAPRGSRKKIEEVVPVEKTYDDFPNDDAVSMEYAGGIAEAEGVLKVRSAEGTSLIVNDLIFNQPHGPGFMGFLFRILGSTGGPMVTGISRMFMVKDKRALRAYLERLADEPNLRRLIVSHGDPVNENVAGVLRSVAAAL